MSYGPLDRVADEEYNRLLKHLLYESAAACGISRSQLLQLMNESDNWSFVVRVHTLCETAVRHLLAHAMSDHQADVVAAQLAASRGPLRAKLYHVQKTSLLTQWKVAQVRVLSEMRNSAVHDSQQLNFTFEEFTASDSSLCKQFATAFSKAQEPPTPEEKEVLEKRALGSPQRSIAVAVLGLLVAAYPG